MGELLAVTALLLFAGNAFLVRPAGRRVPQDLGFVVVLVANVAFGVVLLAAQAALGRWPDRLDVPALAAFALAGVFAGYLGRLGYFRSVELVGPSRASAVQNCSPLFALVLAWVVLDQALAAAQVLCMLLVVLGLLAIGSRRSAAGVGEGRAGRSLLARALLLGLGSAAAYGIGNVMRGFAVDRWDEALVGALAGAVTATSAYLLVHPAARAGLRTARTADPRGLALWGLSGSLMICGQASVIAATAHLPVAVVVAVSSSTPVVVVPVSALLARGTEGLSAVVAVGALVITTGVVLLLLL